MSPGLLQMKKANIISRLFFSGLEYYLILLLPVTFFGFYPTYISKPVGAFNQVVHLHGLLMLVWLLLVVAQPLLISFRKFSLHRMLGRLSYFIMPVIIVSGYLIISFSYRQFAAGERMQALSFWPPEWPLQQKAAASAVIGSVYLVWLSVYFSLGILSRKKAPVHGMYMLAAGLTILGPSGDRLVGFLVESLGWSYNTFAEYFIFIFTGVFFTFLLFRQRLKGLDIKPALIILSIHLAGIFLYYFLPHSRTWAFLAERIF